MPSVKFCEDCGQPLSGTPASKPTPKDLTFDEKLAKIQKYLPGNITEKILSQRNRIEGERKQVSVLFTDMAGYTTMSEKLDAEEVYSLMDQVYEILIHKVTEYGGTVNEFTGDGIMALFGAPIALEDAPQRAIRASLAIHREIVQFNERMKREKPGHIPLRMRAGIHTGPVVVGTVGNDLRVTFTAIGDTVNLASRMETLAEPGSTCVSDDTFKLTEGLFRFEGLGEKEIKGKEKPICVYRVIASSTSRTRFDVSAERGLTPFVGRERERELLLDAFERARQGRGQAVSIVSEAGMGKSRLLYEFRKAITNEQVTFLEGKCLSYSQGVTYQPVIDLLKGNFDIGEKDGDLDIREKVRQRLKVLQIDENTTLPYFLELLSVQDSGIEKISLSPEGKRDQIFQVLTRLVLKGADVQPLILAVEDLHWIDKSSEEAFKELFEHIAGARVLLIFTYRTEYIHTWGGRSFHSQITLNRLSNREALSMVTHLLGTERIAENLQDLILEKTEGVPFFIEEFLKSLKDLRIIHKQNTVYVLTRDPKDVAIPSTIQDVILARVDVLPEGAKEVLQTGSVIEREFPYPLIQRITNLPERTLLSHLSALKEAELLYERGVFPDSTYIFKHALTREVVYRSILSERKKRFHEEIGGAIEEVFKDHLSDYCEPLSYHYFAAGNFIKAAEQSNLAALKAAKRSLINESIAFTERTISSLEQLPKTSEIQKKIITARTNLGLRFLEMNYFYEAGKAIEPLTDLANCQDYNREVSRLFIIIGTLDFCIREDFSTAFKHLFKGLEIAKRNNDFSSQAIGNYWLSYALSMNCSFDSAFEYLKQVIDHDLEANQLSWAAVVKALTVFLALFLSGKITAADRMSLEALGLAEASGDLYSKVFAYSTYGLSCYGRGQLESAIVNLLKAKELNEKVNQFWWFFAGHYYLGEIFFHQGNYLKAILYYEMAIEALESRKVNPSWLILSEMALARSKSFAGDSDFHPNSIGTSISKNKVKIHDGQLNHYMAEILMKAEPSQPKIIEEWILRAISTDKNNKMQWHLGMDYALYSEFLKQKGEGPKAHENLGKAIEIMKDCGADGWVKRYEERLAVV
jgi:class 3 adenylate cyclase/tetratricopeptide (TPR) repeat protein